MDCNLEKFNIGGWHVECRIVCGDDLFKSKSFSFSYPDKKKILDIISSSLNSYSKNAYVDRIRIIPDIDPLDVTMDILKK